MNLLEYIKLPKGEPLVPKVGDRFRPLESNDNVKVGDIANFYEVISVKLDTGLISGYEVMPVYEKITERCP